MRMSSWFLFFRKKYEIVKQADFLKDQIKTVLQANTKQREQFQVAVQEVEDSIIDYRAERDRLEEANAKLQNSLNGAMQKLEILEEITIPYLYKLLSTYSTSWDCQTAQNAMRTAFVESKQQRENE